MIIRRLDIALPTALVVAGLLAACASSGRAEGDGIEPPPAGSEEDGSSPEGESKPDASTPGKEELPYGAIPILAEKQRTGGDPEEGYRALVNDAYCSVGIPWSGFSFAMTKLEARDSVPGREGNNTKVGYGWNVAKKPSGVTIAAMSCLNCHATHLRGKLVVGLGRPSRDQLVVTSGMASNPALITAGLLSPAEYLEYQTYGLRLANIASGAFATFNNAMYRDPKTLAWSSSRKFDSTTGLEGWVDIPPWWRTKKKNALYASGMGRGDHSRHMMNMTLFSVEDVAEAKRLDAMFVDIAAYLRSIEPPKFPAKTDAKLVAAGRKTFEARCSVCHGTYGDDAAYPNLLIPLDSIGTDPQLAQRSWVNDASAKWWTDSYYGENSRFEKHDGYVAPPLDGVWATAPFFHNGSVPTLEAVLDSSKRPASWSSAFGDDDYDLDSLGWRAGDGLDYDTTRPGMSNAGHTFGDVLEDDERTALVEYLKTL